MVAELVTIKEGGTEEMAIVVKEVDLNETTSVASSTPEALVNPSESTCFGCPILGDLAFLVGGKSERWELDNGLSRKMTPEADE